MDTTAVTTTRDSDVTALRAAIDKSVRWPVLFFFTGAGFWLFVSLLAGFWADYRLSSPGGPESWAFLSYPRLQPAHMSMLIYGWGFNMAFGVMLWLMARLCRREEGGALTYVVAGKIWNILIALGVLGILLGKGTGVAWLEFPAWTWPALFLSYAIIAARLFALFLRREGGHTFISLWYMVTALFAFPWLLLTAWVMIHLVPGAAVMGPVVNQWYIGGLVHLFFIPVGLAVTYYLAPKVTGREIRDYRTANIAFWAVIGIGAWTGIRTLMGGPLPAWMPTVGGAASIAFVVPAIMVFRHIGGTLRGQRETVEQSATLRFVVAANWGFLLFALLAGAFSLLCLSRVTQLTEAEAGLSYAVLFGFFTLAMFAAVAFITPRLTECSWPSANTLRIQFWFMTFGVATIILASVAGGIAQGRGAYDYLGDWQAVVDAMLPFLRARLFAFALLLLLNILFLRQFALMMLRKGWEFGQATFLPERTSES
jgi:cytochrome c oxidase cbb3-type subunit 1